VIAVIAILLFGAVCALLLREHRRLTNLVVAKNPDVVLAAERNQKPRKKDKDDKPRAAWLNPSEAVGP